MADLLTQVTRLRNEKAKKPTYKIGYPSNAEGDNGDLAFRSTENGLGLYGKVNNEWFKFGDGLRIGRFGTGRKYTNSGSWGKDLVGDNITIGNKKTKLDSTSLKKSMSLENVTNESKTIMFNNPQITGDWDGSETNPVINTANSNIVMLAFNNASADFYCRLIGAAGNLDNAIQFYTGGTPYWTMGYNDDSGGGRDFQINTGNDLGSNNKLRLNSSGNLSITGDLTVSGGDIISGADTTLTLAADLNVDVHLDNDGDGTQYFRVLDGADAPNFSVAETGAVTCTTVDTGQGANELYDMDQNVKTDSTVGFAEITSGAIVWQEWVFNTFRGVANRYYYRDKDDADDWRRWDAYSTLDGSGDIVITTQFVSGHFVVPENCTLVAMHGQIYNAGSTSCPTVSVFSGTPSDSSSLTASSRGNTQPNSGSALTSNQNYTFNKTDFDYDLTRGDIVLPTIHYGAGSLQSFIGCLTLKFVTR